MIDGGESTKRSKRKGKTYPRSTFVAKSMPSETDEELPELEFPGPSATYRGAGSFYLDPRPKRSECLPRELNLEEMAYTGYWRCAGPCYHVQPEEKGEGCEKCGKQMTWESGVPK